MFEAQDLLIVCSTSGQLFEYNRRRVRKLKQMPVRKWLITWNANISFCHNQLVILSLDSSCNEMIMTYVIHTVLMHAETL